MPSKDFIVAINYAAKYGSYTPNNRKQMLKAYKEFGKSADKKLGINAPNGLNGVWCDEVKQFVEPGIIDWSWTKNL
jgi:hypothetical protein